ncbi:hypothetical protein N7E02_26560 [Aliirhizobium terrae]|uniref:hypothetical protein n=1 Tax=Terrirhizobium terrae TaxID=2926709 RepID=UPI00257642AA|nr:hypothetical protein [Rhizobium sp. CC-CFT758]WJH40152.1 hypothetical protein N7E02_26560 [Rhizobium sp. CC-CFT758]
MPEVRKPEAAVFAIDPPVSFLTRLVVLSTRYIVVEGSLSAFVSKKLTNKFLTFSVFGASRFGVSENPEVIAHFLSIPHAIG